MSHLREATPTLAPITQPRAAWWQRGLLLGPTANQEARNVHAAYLEIACSGLATGIVIFVGPLLGSMLSTLVGLIPALLVVAAMRTASGFVFQGLRY